MRYKLVVSMGSLLILLSMLLGACGGTSEIVYVTQTVVVTVEVTPEAPPIEEATPEPPPVTRTKILVVCLGQEPDTLYLYSDESPTLAARHIQHAVYDGPIDNRAYDFQPVILEKLPSLEDGDAVINTVTVQAGDRVVNDAGAVVDLEEGDIIRPTGCNAAECAVEFDGTPVQMDRIVATFRIIAGVAWSDGTPLTADDSVYGYELTGDPGTPTDRELYDRTASYVALDTQTTVWTGLPGYIDHTYFTNFWHPFPRHLWQSALGYTAADLLEAEESTRMPMGWGAFVIQEWVSGDHITAVRNPYYFRADEGLPYIDTVVFRFVRDPNAAVAQLISGECDIVTRDSNLESQADLLLKLDQQNVIATLFEPGRMWEHANFGIDFIETYARPDFFSDARVRQAIALCLDRQGAADALLYGRSPVMHTYVPPEHPLYAEDRITVYDHDPAAGMALLEEVGWVLPDDAAIREAQDVDGVPDGTSLAFNWGSAMDNLSTQYIRRYQQDLAECGIQVNLEALPADQWLADGPQGPLFGRRFDIGSFAWRLPGFEPPCDLYVDFEGENIPSEANAWTGLNTPGFSDPEYDAACNRAHTAFPGTEDYIEGHKEAQRIFSEQLPVIPLFMRLNFAATRPGVSGLILDSTESSEMWNIEAFDKGF